MIEEQEFIQEFVDEASHHLNEVKAILMDADGTIMDAESIHTIFQEIHTIKGIAGFFGLSKTVFLAYTMESILDEVRRGCMELDKNLVDLILATHVQLKDMVEDVLNSENRDIYPLMNKLKGILNSNRKRFVKKSRLFFSRARLI